MPVIPHPEAIAPPRRIEDYALIGDCETAALVCNDGSIDWLCWPRFDSPACLAALLGNADNGRWLIAPRAPGCKVKRQYRAGTLILETEFETEHGAVKVIDFMPVRTDTSRLFRIVQGVRGEVEMLFELSLRFDYGVSVPWASRRADHTGMDYIVGPNRVALRTPLPVHGEGSKTVCRFTVGAHDSYCFELSYGLSHLPVPEAGNGPRALRDLEERWQRWSQRCVGAGPWSDAVRRSLITLKGLTYQQTGGIVAAPTTSLPEWLGGERNWDYRYCWLRDATLSLTALMAAGYYDEARAWRAWLVRAVAGDASQIQIMYGIAGERQLDERVIAALPGFAQSRPVRIGNQASTQLQLDVYGELMDALHQCRKYDLSTDEPHELGTDEATWQVQLEILEHLEDVWQEPDEGIWEVRGGRRQFTYSKVMAWVAFDRAIKSVEMFGFEGPVERWRELRDTIHRQVCERGFNAQRNSFVQSYGSDALDASLLLITLVGFLPPDDARIVGTVSAIERELVVDGFVVRYLTQQSTDGLPPGEGAFLACSFWLADNLALQGRMDEARTLFERLLTVRNDVGLLAEEYDPLARVQLGNFPQAFSHVALIHTALNLVQAGSTEGSPAEARAL
jgi:GH15 family glucan-1,4-alpha-glucosidase